MATIVNLHDEMDKVSQRLNVQEEYLATGLMQPFTNTNSGARKIMFGTQLTHALNLLRPEVPIIQTGYENRYGDRSSSIIKAETDTEVMDKIVKFKNIPNHCYYLITRNKVTNELGLLKRMNYNHNTETYGYIYNNDILDNLEVGYEIPKDEILRKSTAYDEYNNRCDGVNLLVAYISSDKTMEDGIQISQSAAKKLAVPLIKEVTVMINDNDIPLNIYGDNEVYKSFPAIGEKINGGILCSIRKEKIEEALYSQSYDRLRIPMMSDEKYTVEGKIIDIDIVVNNPSILEERYTYCQLLDFYNEKKRFLTDIVQSVDRLKSMGYTKLSYELSMLYDKSIQELNGTQYLENNKIFSGAILKFIVLEENIPSVGDKITNRYGGKGVIAEIVPDELMPTIDSGETIEMIMNSSTCVNRENAGQLMETSLTHIGGRIVEFIKTNVLTTKESIDMILKFISMCSQDQAKDLSRWLSILTEDELEIFIDQIKLDGNLCLSIRPVSESMSIDKLNLIYKEFPWINQHEIYSPIKDSNGCIRYIKGRRKLTCGKMYVYRLKQYAEEKFSVTSLSSTNIRNENSRSKANKNYKALHQNTPIKFGDMEQGDLIHVGSEITVIMLMLYSTSPKGRRLVEPMLTDNPYEIDIRLDKDSVNRNAEILNVYLKVIGLRFDVIKIPKKIEPAVLRKPISYQFTDPYTKPVFYIPQQENINILEYIKYINKLEEEAKQRPVMYEPVYYTEY